MITPQQIDQISFSKVTFGGYNMQQVDEILEPLTEDYVTLYKENALLKSKMRVLVGKLEEYRKNEAAVKDAAVNAKRACDRMMQEAEAKAAQMVQQAKAEAAAAAVMAAASAPTPAAAPVVNNDALVAAEEARVVEARKTANRRINEIQEQMRSCIQALERIKGSAPVPATAVAPKAAAPAPVVPAAPVVAAPAAPVVPAAPAVAAPAAPVVPAAPAVAAPVAPAVAAPVAPAVAAPVAPAVAAPVKTAVAAPVKTAVAAPAAPVVPATPVVPVAPVKAAEPAPAPAAKPSIVSAPVEPDFDSLLFSTPSAPGRAPSKSDDFFDSDDIASQISLSLEAMVGTTHDVAPKAPPKHPTHDATTSRFTNLNLQFGRNYDPTH